MKKILLLFLAVIFLLSSVPVSAATDMGIMYELQNATIDGEKFDITNYPKVTGGQAELLAFREYGYTISGPSDIFALYLYVYNKSERQIKTWGENMITIATSFDENGNAKTYSKFKLVFIEASPDNRFLKFEVAVSPISTVVKNRKYQISEFELQYASNSNATASGVGSIFTFSGYTADKNLTTTRKDIKTIRSEVTYTYFRTQTSDAGVGHQNQLNSVYFTVPNELLESKGFLSRIKIAYRKQRTAPIFVTDDDEVYTALSEQIGVENPGYNKNIPFGLYAYELTDSVNYRITYDYNMKYITGGAFVADVKDIDRIAYVFKTDEYEAEKISVKSENLLAHIYKYNKASWLFEDKVKTELTSQDIYLEDGFELTSYYDSLGKISKFFYDKLFGGVVEDSFEDIVPFYYVTAADVAKSVADMASALYITEDAAADIKSKYSAASASNQTIVIFRYSETDYFLREVRYTDDCLGVSNSDKEFYFAQEDIYFDWDMIELEFELDGEKTIMPVISSPEDQAGDITDPVKPPSNKKDNKKDDNTSDLSWVLSCLGMILGIVALCFVLRYMTLILEFINTFFNMFSDKKHRRDKP